jgi:thymidine kinase
MSLTLTFGPMHSGKTTELLDEAARINAMGLKCLYVNSTIDTRTSDEVSTHNPLLVYRNRLPNVTFVKVSRLADLNVADFYKVLIDEGQFFDDLRDSVIHFIDVCEKLVHISALTGDFNRRPFGEVLSLIPLVDNPKSNIIFKTSYCTRCAREDEQLVDAAFSYRLNREERAQIAIGNGKKYEPLCAKHYKIMTLPGQ